MFERHVKRDISAYCHGELTSARSKAVAEHLMICGHCRQEYARIKLGIRLAAHLEQIPAPDGLWNEVERRLDLPVPGAEGVSPAKQGVRRILTSKYMLAGIAAVIIVAASATFEVRRQAKPSWEIIRLEGAPVVGREQITGKGRLATGDWLETDRSSKARIDINQIGQVEVEPGTRVQLLESKESEYRLALAQGRLSARITAPPRLFFVNTPSAVAIDLGCAYTLEVSRSGVGLLRVTTGWVEFVANGRVSRVPAEGVCATRPGIGPGTPYFEDAPEELKEALSVLDFGGDAAAGKAIDSSSALDTILASARKRDTLTLWHLLPRVSGLDRERIYDRIAAFVPPPDGVTRAGVMRLDQKQSDLWFDDIVRAWFGY
ncbi:MAG TPA: zf-HC2 domain-containing protein [Blastocatellia bacterium]|nr:zf-HC2 domain-containing protein [Blastocatellia bacterium]